MTFHRGLPHTALALLLSATLTACGGSSSSSRSSESFTDAAVISGGIRGAGGVPSGAVELIDLTRTPLRSTGGYFTVPTTDLSIATQGSHYYRIGRYEYDTIQKVDIGNPAIEQWEFSTLEAGDEDSSNPHNLVFESEQRAYLLRYGSTHAWIVNPSAVREEEFKIGEIDLSHYNAGNGLVPRMTSGLIVDDKLFIVMQRLDRDWNYHPSYVAVFDISGTSVTEIETGQGNNGLKGIELIGQNPSDIVYHPDVGILVQSTGDRSTYTGGIDHIDPATFAVSQRVDDTEETHTISGIALQDADTAYLVSYVGWGDNHIYRFNPVTGEVDTGAPIAGSTKRNIAALTFSPSGQLWVADATPSDYGVRLIDPATDSEIDFIPTSMPPTSIGFIVSE